MLKTSGIENITINNKEYSLDSFNSLKNLNFKSNYISLLKALENDNPNKKKLEDLEVCTIHQNLESIIDKAEKAKELKIEKDWLTQNPKYYRLLALAKSAISVAVIAGGILAGTAAVVFLGFVGPVLATLIATITLIISMGLGTAYAYQGGTKNIMQAEMGLLALAPIAPFIPLWTYFFRDKEITQHLKKFQTEKDEFERIFTEFTHSINQFYPQFKIDLEAEIENLNSKQNESADVSQRLQLITEIKNKRFIAKMSTYKSEKEKKS